jgi:twinkle protein
MTVLTGIPGSGKSTWLDALAVNLYLQHEWKIAFCSPENWPVQRHMASIAEKLVEKPFAAATPSCPRMSEEELRRAMEEVNGAFFWTQLPDDEMNIDGVLEVMQAAISRHGVKGVVLDPWNELEYNRPAHLSETQFVSEALGKIRRFARMNNVHVWIVAHPQKLRKNEDGTYPVPRLYDISGSAHWFNKADNGIAVYRKDPKGNDVEVYVQKIRFREVGQIGRIDMRFIKDSGTFIEVENQ